MSNDYRNKGRKPSRTGRKASYPTGDRKVSPSAVTQPRARDSSAPIPKPLNLALKQLANHSLEQTRVLASMSKNAAKPGAFSNLGGDVDSMIEHGQEAWATVKRLLNVETKALIGTMTSAAGVGVSSYNVDITALISQGITDAQRTGDSIKINKIQIPFSLHMNAASTTNSIARVLVTKANDEYILPGEILQSSGTVYAPLSTRTWDYKQTYQTLYDSGPIPVNSTRPVHAEYLDLDLKDGHVQYAPASTTVLSGCVQVFFFSNEAANMLTMYSGLSVQFVDN